MTLLPLGCLAGWKRAEVAAATDPANAYKANTLEVRPLPRTWQTSCHSGCTFTCTLRRPAFLDGAFHQDLRYSLKQLKKDSGKSRSKEVV